MKNRFDSSFFSSVARIALGYALGRALYGIGRSLVWWIVILLLLGLLGILAAVAPGMQFLGHR